MDDTPKDDTETVVVLGREDGGYDLELFTTPEGCEAVLTFSQEWELVHIGCADPVCLLSGFVLDKLSPQTIRVTVLLHYPRSADPKNRVRVIVTIDTYTGIDTAFESVRY